jgi:RecB family exonuclease
MFKYPFGSVWLSHSSISDFEKCPRLYFLRNIYKKPPENKKIQVVNPYLTLGITVHDTLESIRYLPKNLRFEKPLTDIYEELWTSMCEQNGLPAGKRGGFDSAAREKEFKDRGMAMVKMVQDHPGPVANLSTIIKSKGEMVASMWLSEIDGLVLCGNVDWVEVLPDGTLHIIDFKTGKNEEDSGSLQLQIYLLLAAAGNRRPVTKTSYWYLEKESSPREVPIPDLSGVMDVLIAKGRKIKQARLNQNNGGLACPEGGCRYCRDYEKVFRGEAENVGIDPIREKLLYYLN